MKFKNISYQKTEINADLILSDDFYSTIVDNKGVKQKMIKYKKDTVIGSGKCIVEFVVTRGVKEETKNNIKYYLFFKDFAMSDGINTNDIFFSKSILNDEKIGLNEERLKQLKLSYKLNGNVVDITDEKKQQAKATKELYSKFTKYFEAKIESKQKEQLKEKEEETLKIEKSVDKKNKPATIKTTQE